MSPIDRNDLFWKQIGYPSKKRESKGLTKLLSRMLIDENFSSEVLSLPEVALSRITADGYTTYNLLLTPKERELIRKHSAKTREEFAQYLIDNLWPED